MYIYAQRWTQNMTKGCHLVVSFRVARERSCRGRRRDKQGKDPGIVPCFIFLDRTSRRMVSVSSEPARFPTGLLSCATLPGSLPSAGRDADTTVPVDAPPHFGIGSERGDTHI